MDLNYYKLARPFRSARFALRVALAGLILLSCVAPAFGGSSDSSSSYDSPPSDLAGMTGLREHGFDFSVWGWLAYTATSQHEYYPTYWSSELELDMTQTFYKRVTLAADVEFVDYNDEMYGDFEQLFSSVLLCPSSGLLVTAGKFNSPFGVEGHDFWDRLTATPSLLFRAQPLDLRGVILTAPLGESKVTLRPFIVSGFSNEDEINGWPSSGVVAEYHPERNLDLAATAWIGPGIYPAQYPNGYGGGPSKEYEAYETVELTNSWSAPTFRASGRGQLYFTEGHATWKPRRDLTLVAEVLYGLTDQRSFAMSWFGAMLLGNFDIDDRLRVYGMWSYLDDSGWMVYPERQRRHELSAGLGYRINRHWEIRTEYRRDITDAGRDVNSFSVHASFGY